MVRGFCFVLKSKRIIPAGLLRSGFSEMTRPEKFTNLPNSTFTKYSVPHVSWFAIGIPRLRFGIKKNLPTYQITHSLNILCRMFLGCNRDPLLTLRDKESVKVMLQQRQQSYAKKND